MRKLGLSLWRSLASTNKDEDEVKDNECAELGAQPLLDGFSRGPVGDETEAHHQQDDRHDEEEFIHLPCSFKCLTFVAVCSCYEAGQMIGQNAICRFAPFPSRHT